MDRLTIEASAVKEKYLPSFQEPIIYELDSSLEHGSLHNSPQNLIRDQADSPQNEIEDTKDGLQLVICDTDDNLQIVIQETCSLDPNVIHETKESVQNVIHDKGDNRLNVFRRTTNSPQNMQDVIQNTVLSCGNVKTEISDEMYSPENVIQDVKPDLADVRDRIEMRQGLQVDSHSRTETQDEVQNITLQLDDSEIDETPVYHDIKPVIVGNLPVSSMNESSLCTVQDVFVESPSVCTVQDIILEIKSPLVPRVPTVVQTLETNLDISSCALHESGGSEIGMYQSGVVYQDLKPVLLDNPDCSLHTQPESMTGSLPESHQNIQIDTKSKQDILTVSPPPPPSIQIDTKDVSGMKDYGSSLQSRPVLSGDENNDASVSSPCHCPNESKVVVDLSNISKPYQPQLYTNQVRENHGLETSENRGDALLQEFHNITVHNRLPETIMLGPAEMVAMILDPNSLEVEERVNLHNKSLRLKKFKKKSVEMNLSCEWDQCEDVSNDLNKFIFHITKHIEQCLEEYAKEPGMIAAFNTTGLLTVGANHKGCMYVS
jgi:hypothetical protein